MKWEVVVEASGIPLAVVTVAANVPETVLGPAVLLPIPAVVAVPHGVPVPADEGYDSDPLREPLAGDGFTLLSPHRANRVKPATNDGRRMRRSKRRYEVERTFARRHSFRRVATRFEKTATLYGGFVGMAVALVCLGKLIPAVMKWPLAFGEGHTLQSSISEAAWNGTIASMSRSLLTGPASIISSKSK